MDGVNSLMAVLVVLVGCNPGEVVIPVGAGASKDLSTAPDLAPIDCTMTFSAVINCTDVDTKIPYETGHRGCKFRHDRCADFEGDNFLWDRSKPPGSGREPKIAGKFFDYWRKIMTAGATDIIGDAKVHHIDIDLPQFIVESQAKELLPEILVEYSIAKQCGYRYELLVSDSRLAKTLQQMIPVASDFLFREVQGCRP